MLQVRTFIFNFIEENCYVLWDDVQKDVCWVVDCGAQSAEEFNSLAEFLSSEGLVPTRHLLTHAHFDHVWGAKSLEERYGVCPTLLREELPVYEEMNLQVQTFLHRTFDIPLPPVGDFLSDGQKLQLGRYTFEVIATPGHTPGGCCYYCAEAGILLSGDTLFQGAYGRTDFPRGSMTVLRLSLLHLLQLPSATQVFPGHGPITTIGREANIIS